MSFLCGAAREDITPIIGTQLYGYRPDLISTSIHDLLTITAVAFGDGHCLAVLLSATLGDIHTALSDEIRGKASAACGAPKQDIILAATHTHSGPNTSGEEGWGDIDRPYCENILIPAAQRAAKNAVAAMTEAEVGVASGRSEVGINRRQHLENGEVILGQNPWGMFDPSMTVCTFRRADNHKGILNLIHYGCHGTACGCHNEITRDWSGVMIDRMENMTGTMTVYVNGAVGDVGPRLTNGKTVGDISYVEELGSVAASDAIRINNEIKSFSAVPVQTLHGTIHLPYQKNPTLEEVRAGLADIREPEKLINIEALHYHHLRALENMLSLKESVTPPKEFTFEQTLLSVGDTVFIPFPFEFFSEISLRLRAYSSYQHTLCLSNTDGYNAYLPSQDQLCRGGYEVGVFRYNSLYSLADNTDDNIIRENLRILDES